MADLEIRPTTEADRPWVRAFTVEHWGADFVVVHGAVLYPDRIPGFAAFSGPELAGLATYSIDGPACELVTLNAVPERHGVGTALLQAVIRAARRAGCERLWLVTTNDNLKALAFYQKRGMHLVALHRGAVTAARHLKPSIPECGPDGIPIRDELELEQWLRP